MVIDGDHNWWTVHEELRLLGERAPGADFPLVFFHDVCWPHGRRDDYFAPELIPAEHRQPLAGGQGGLVPGEPGLVAGGLPYPKSAAREGGPRNGVLTAAEDFAAERPDLRLAVIPVFFGFGVLWPTEAPWAAAVARIVDPLDRHPVLERLEGNRVHHLALGHQRLVASWEADARRARQEAVLRRMLDSSAFSVAEKLSRLRVRLGIAPDSSTVSKAEIRAALED